MQEHETVDLGWNLRPTEDGIRVGDSILWLDAQSTPDLSFLSCASSLQGRTSSKIITTEETTRLLAQNNMPINALISAYNQRIAIGQFRLELLPSGAGLGASSLRVETRFGSLLYAPRLQPQKTGISRTMQLSPADTLILGAFTPFPPTHHPSRKKEKERLLLTIQEYLKRDLHPVIVCDPFAVAQELCLLLAEAGIATTVAGSIFRTNKVYESYGSELGGYSMLGKKGADNRVILMPSVGERRQALPEGPLFVIDESAQEPSPADIMRPVAERFVIPQNCDARELKSVIQTVSPREVYFTGPYAKQYARELSSPKVHTQALFPSHLPALF